MKKKLLVAGHNGMVGSAICRLNQEYQILQIPKQYVNLKNQRDVDISIKHHKPDMVVICAAKVGGIQANSIYPAEFIYDNLMIQSNIIHSSFKNGVKQLLFLGSSCIYPKHAPQPIKEEYLLSSSLEPTNEAYAIAKIAGLKMCQYYRKQYGVNYCSIMPTNLYGINDNYHPENSHVIPGLIRRFHEAKINNLPEVKMWGTGKPQREFLYVDDLANIIFQLLKIDNLPDWINVGSPYEYTITETASLIKEVVGYKGKITQDLSKPDGTPRKKLDTSLIETVIRPAYTEFKEGLESAYADFLQKY